MRLGSIAPERVAPGSPFSGVSPMDVSMDCPWWIAQADAPEPKCKTISDRVLEGLSRNLDTERRMKESA